MGFFYDSPSRGVGWFTEVFHHDVEIVTKIFLGDMEQNKVVFTSLKSNFQIFLYRYLTSRYCYCNLISKCLTNPCIFKR